jgi:hypothetical protein
VPQQIKARQGPIFYPKYFWPAQPLGAFPAWVLEYPPINISFIGLLIKDKELPILSINPEEISQTSCLRIELLESLKKHCNTAGLVSTTKRCALEKIGQWSVLSFLQFQRVIYKKTLPFFTTHKFWKQFSFRKQFICKSGFLLQNNNKPYSTYSLKSV